MRRQGGCPAPLQALGAGVWERKLPPFEQTQGSSALRKRWLALKYPHAEPTPDQRF